MPRAAARVLSSLSLLALVLPAPLPAQMPTAKAAPPAATAGSAQVAVAVRRSGPIELDGRLDDAAWAAAPVATQFVQQWPDEGKPPRQPTEVRFLFDDDALYVGARMYDSGPVTSRLARRDTDPQSDWLTVELDTYHDRLHSVFFSVNPAGVRNDGLDNDNSWDPVWQAAAQVDSAGWTAELRIPLSQLRFSRDSVQRWGLELTRITARTHETDLWSFFSRKDAGGPAFFGVLEGVLVGRRPAHAEAMPYVVARSAPAGSGDAADPFKRAHRADVRAGADLRYGLSSSLTLDATVNPDFGQVEVDPAVVNLTAYETYYPEKRPFFVERSSLFDYGTVGCNINCGNGLDLFYSRRIGRPPQGAALAYAAGRYADVPENTTILGAAKLTGRTAGGLSVGVLDGVTAAEQANVATVGGGRVRQMVQPAANALVARATQEYRGGNVVLGGLLTSSYRDLSDPGLARLLDRDAEVGGVDARLMWGKREYTFYLALAGSHAGGDSAAVGLLRRSSARYLQRPDRPAGSYDPGATALTGYGATGRIGKIAGNWLWDLNGLATSPGFEANDLGFMPQVDRLWVNGSLGRQWTRPGSWYRTVVALVDAEGNWNYQGNLLEHDVTGFATAQLPNYWQATLMVEHIPPYLDDGQTRGGPVVRRPGQTVGIAQLATDTRRTLVLSADVELGRGPEGNGVVSLSPGLTCRPAANVSLSASPTWQRIRSSDQYVASIPDATAASFYGQRYVFARIDQTQVFMTTRADVTFTPSLTLQLYAQPLLASTDYYDFEEFAHPRALTKLVYGRDVGTITPTPAGYTVDPDGTGPAAPFTIANPDFNFRSLRGTGVLRWEWRPGSTIYLVWTQTRSDTAPLGDFDFGRDRAALFATPPQNVFLVKISYWLGR